jgi:hypothetical protein
MFNYFLRELEPVGHVGHDYDKKKEKWRGELCLQQEELNNEREQESVIHCFTYLHGSELILAFTYLIYVLVV